MLYKATGNRKSIVMVGYHIVGFLDIKYFFSRKTEISH